MFHEKKFCWREIQTGSMTDDNNADIVGVENNIIDFDIDKMMEKIALNNKYYSTCFLCNFLSFPQ